jgi:uncharacterized protein YprB with RNaseH-like and TPR domain
MSATMDKFARLAALRPATGVAFRDARLSPEESPTEGIDECTLAQLLGATIARTKYGSHLSVRNWHSTPERPEVAPTALDLLCRTPDAAQTKKWREAAADAEKWLFLDTETTGLAGGTGTYAFLVGAGWLEDDRFVVVQHFMRDLDEEPALLAALAPLLDRASGFVTFNGSGFDVPLLETRFILGRRRWPTTLPHVDLMWPARRVWAARFVNCRLGTLEREVLGHVRDEDVAGALIPSLYFDFIRRRHAAPLAPVFTHNRHDVLSLVALLGWLGHALANGGHGVDDGLDLAGLGRLWERSDPERAAACYRGALASGLPAPAAHVVRLRLADWEKRGAQWEAACALWEAAAAGATFDPRPWVELAKYHEHRARNAAAARMVVTAARMRAEAAGASAPIIEALAYRLERLERRLALSRAHRQGRDRG